MAVPTTYTWVLAAPSYPAPGSFPSTSYLALCEGHSTANPQYFTEADLLAVLDRVLPEWYLDPIKNPGPGYELYQSAAKAAERASLAVGRLECAGFIMFAHGGCKSIATVEFYRHSVATGAFTVQRGTICRASKSGRSYALLEDVVFTGVDYFKVGQVGAVAAGYEYDVPGPVSTADGTILPGEIDSVVVPLLDPPFAEPAILCKQVSDATGGQPPVLDQHGADRLIARLPGETDEVYKGRINQLPDTISPDALRNQLDAMFLPLGYQYDLIETWENRYQSCWNAPDGQGVHPVFGQLAQWAYNDPRDDVFIPRWMSEGDHRGAIVVVVPNSFPTFADRGMAWNDPATEGLTSRGTSAWNAPALDGEGLSGVWNGEDDDSAEGRAAFLRKVWDLLRQIKGGGIAVAMIPAELNEFVVP